MFPLNNNTMWKVFSRNLFLNFIRSFFIVHFSSNSSIYVGNTFSTGMAEEKYSYAKKQNLKFRMYVLKRQVLKTFMYSHSLGKKFPNVTKDDLTTQSKHVLEIKSCIDNIENLFLDKEEEEEMLDLEMVMETGELPKNINISK